MNVGVLAKPPSTRGAGRETIGDACALSCSQRHESQIATGKDFHGAIALIAPAQPKDGQPVLGHILRIIVEVEGLAIVLYDWL